MGKLATAKLVLQNDGIPGIIRAFKEQYLDRVIGDQINWCYGKLLEYRGNSVKIDGCTFSLDSDAITTQSKSKFMFGQYEKPERQAVVEFLDPSLPVVEFGGSIGVVSCLTNRKLEHPESHVVVEANPALVPVLIRNRDLNNCKFAVLPRMIGYNGQMGTFFADNDNFVIGTAVSTESESLQPFEVPTVSLRSILDEYGFQRCTLICDIEGGESDLLKYESDVLKNRIETIILEVHEWSLGKARVTEMLSELRLLGFKEVLSQLDTYVFQK
jgi:FkbM family methyltransferase